MWRPPVFRKIADKIYATDLDLHAPLSPRFARQTRVLPVIQAGLRSDLQLICKTLNIEQMTRDETEWARAEHGGDKVIWNDNGEARGTLPDVEGMMLRDAPVPIREPRTTRRVLWHRPRSEAVEGAGESGGAGRPG